MRRRHEGQAAFEYAVLAVALALAALLCGQLLARASDSRLSDTRKALRSAVP
jgi:Flp pilus assembly pilin Flp